MQMPMQSKQSKLCHITYLDARGDRLELDAGIDAPDEVGAVDGQRLQVEEALLLALGDAAAAAAALAPWARPPAPASAAPAGAGAEEAPVGTTGNGGAPAPCLTKDEEARPANVSTTPAGPPACCRRSVADVVDRVRR